jgi:hypothetical protein
MNTTQLQEFVKTLDTLQQTHEKYRLLQEQEHAHLSRRGAISEWNEIVNKKDTLIKEAKEIEKKMSPFRELWQRLGEKRSHPQFNFVREKISQLQALLTRILTCDRMNEVLLYNGGYLQSVMAYRSNKVASPR